MEATSITQIKNTIFTHITQDLFFGILKAKILDAAMPGIRNPLNKHLDYYLIW